MMTFPSHERDHHGHKPVRMVLSLPRACAVVAEGLGGRSIFRRGRYHSTAFPPFLRTFLANQREFSDTPQPPKRATQSTASGAQLNSRPQSGHRTLAPEGGGPNNSPGREPWQTNPPELGGALKGATQPDSRPHSISTLQRYPRQSPGPMWRKAPALPRQVFTDRFFGSQDSKRPSTRCSPKPPATSVRDPKPRSGALILARGDQPRVPVAPPTLLILGQGPASVDAGPWP